MPEFAIEREIPGQGKKCIELLGVYGQVTDIELLSTKLIHGGRSVVTVPNRWAISLERGEPRLRGALESPLKAQHFAQIVVRDEVSPQLGFGNPSVQDQRPRESLHDVAEGVPVE